MANEDRTLRFPFDITSKWDAKILVFNNPADLLHWAETESAAWTKAFNGRDQPRGYIEKARKRHVKTLTKIIERSRALVNGESLQSSQSRELIDLLAYFKSGQALRTDSPIARDVFALLNENDAVGATGLLLAATDMLEKPENFPPGEVNPEDTPHVFARGRELLMRFMRAHDVELLNERVTAIKARADALSSQIDQGAVKYDSTEPVTYWIARASTYRLKTYILMAAFALVLLFALGLISILELPRAFDMALMNDPGFTAYAPAAAITATVFLLIWALRIILRLFYANRELQEDALERVTMLKTLLTLMNNASISPDVKDKVWPKAFDTIFRPQGSHRLDVDSPLEFFTAITERIKGKS